jgi:hypothetical protein
MNIGSNMLKKNSPERQANERIVNLKQQPCKSVTHFNWFARFNNSGVKSAVEMKS